MASGWEVSGKAGSRSPCCTKGVGPSQPFPASVSLLQWKQSIPLPLQGSPCCLLPTVFQLLSHWAAWASLPRQVGMGRVISSPRPVLVCWYPGQCWGTRSIPECSSGNSSMVGVLANPRQLCTEASACSPKGPGKQKLNLAWGRVALKLVPVCVRKGVCGCRGTVPCQLSCWHQSGENHGPLSRGLQLWGAEQEPKMSPSLGQGGHMPTLCFAGHLEPCWPWLAWGPI